MGILYLVRHGQASFGADDYDRLSELGQRQCHALGEHLREQGLRFEAVLRGSLRRQSQSLQAITDGFGALPPAQEWPGLNEYDGHAVVRAVYSGPPPPVHESEGYRQHFRLLREGLQRWMAGQAQPEGMPSYADWVAGIAAALDHVRTQHAGDVLLVSSGGPIATAVGQVLGTSSETTIELNMRIRNSAITELAVNPKRLALLSFNHLPHLDRPGRRDWITHT